MVELTCFHLLATRELFMPDVSGEIIMVYTRMPSKMRMDCLFGFFAYEEITDMRITIGEDYHPCGKIFFPCGEKILTCERPPFGGVKPFLNRNLPQVPPEHPRVHDRLRIPHCKFINCDVSLVYAHFVNCEFHNCNVEFIDCSRDSAYSYRPVNLKNPAEKNVIIIFSDKGFEYEDTTWNTRLVIEV